MLDLCAITGRASEAPFSTDPRKHARQWRRRELFMSIEGDQPLDSLFLDDPELTLICRADLLEPESGPNVAAYLGRLYRAQGDKFVAAIRGTFAIVLYDHERRTLKAWTDHFGAERLVYFELGDSLMVSTDIGKLLNVCQQYPDISPAAIHEYLQYTCIPTPKTIYKGISKVAPGHQLTSKPVTTTRPYWDMVYRYPEGPSRSESAWATETREAVSSAVAESLKNLTGPRGVGCFLSGGTDSSSVAGFIGQLTAQPPRTFSIGFHDPRYNEIEYARIAAKHFSADHHEYFVKPEDIPVLVQKAAQAYDEPFGNSSIVPTYYCARLAAEHGVEYLLAGDGGDELFGGNSRYAVDRVFQRYGQIPDPIRKWLIEPVLSRAARWTNLRLFNTASSYVRRSNIPPPDRYFSYSLIQSVDGAELFTNDFQAAVRGEDPMWTARKHFQRVEAQSDLNRWLYLDLKIIIADNDLRKVTTMSRLAGVTPRFPFLNRALAEFTGRIPPESKVRGSQLRYLFKKAMADLLPREIITKKKHGFGLPYSVWLADSKLLRDFTFDALGSTRCRQRGYFRPGLSDWLWSQYQSVHRNYYGEILWMLVMLELWHVAHVDARPAQERHALAAIPLN
jgi:asparagine synthase (glutamine-hydrolysing)